MGFVYKRGKTYWISYSYKGRRIRESTGSEIKSEAQQILWLKEGNQSPLIYSKHIEFEEVAEDLITDYKINERRSLDRLEQIIRVHLKPFFSGVKVSSIGTSTINKYINNRLGDGVKRSTVNRELAMLKRMLMLGYKSTPQKCINIPHIRMMEENNVKEGFFEHDEFIMFRRALPEHMRGIVTFGYKLGCRLGELIGLKWDNVNRQEGYIRIEGRDTKNKRAKSIYLDEELKLIIKQEFMRRRMDSPYVFRGRGFKINDLRYAWNKACDTIGISGYNSIKGTENKQNLERLTFHDLRRTAIRNMLRSGINERVAMTISGHRTRSIFDRYNIVDEHDLKEAARKMGDCHKYCHKDNAMDS